MTKKDYILIAKAINRVYVQLNGENSVAGRCTLNWLIRELDENLGIDNPRFDSKRFCAACISEVTVNGTD